jgi:acyl dehydratase
MKPTYRAGQELEPLQIGEITRPMINEYSRVANDLNPMHTDEEFAKASGYPTVFAQGMLGMAHLARHVVGISGVGKLRKIKVRFKTMTWPGEVITAKAKVSEVRLDGDKQLVTCDIQTENQDGEPKVIGTATFEV